MSIENIALQSKQNTKTTLASGLTSRLLDVRKERIRESLYNFENVSHRLEFVTAIRGVDFINDSKATNVNATWYGLESMNRPVVWLVGGEDIENDYSILKDIVKEKVKAIICIGIDNSNIKHAFSDIVSDISESTSMEETVSRAFYKAEKGDIVLLSPACSSLDLYDSYEERGEVFKQSVAEL